MERYSVITEKRKREIVLLRGRGCAYLKCAFCDYHLDKCADDEANFELNKSVLDRVTGIYGDLEVINSGSVFELDAKTREYIRSVCRKCGIKVLHFEAHYMYRDKLKDIRREFGDFDVIMKIGLETFDHELREGKMKKGIAERDPDVIAQGFDEANFLFGISGQTVESMLYDIECGLKHFERICVNIMCKNTTQILPDREVIEKFMRHVYPKYKDDPRVDILINNTDFGVGE